MSTAVADAEASTTDRSYVLGVDVGGTFTDAVLLDPSSGELRRSKVSTTPDDQSIGTLATIPDLDISAKDLGLFCHGTTVGINAFLQRSGAKVGLICTEGTRDLLDVGKFVRDPAGLYDPTWKRPHQARPMVHRRHIREVTARVLYDGSTDTEIDEDQVRRELEFLVSEGVEAVAICLLNSYVTLEHEERIVALVNEVMPGAYVQSSSLRPVIGEYARTTAIVLDAYTGPIVSRYLGRLQSGLRDIGYDGPAVIMQMNGGVRTLERTIEHFPAYTMVSGPVAGILGAEYFAANFLDVPNLVCIDIGGTSTDLGLVIDGVAQSVSEWEAEWALTLGMPSVDVRSIGAGGGSLIQTDAMGTLRVGPESAGAQPGPVAYGRGGTEPTVTDAHAVLGTMRPETFLGGRMKLEVEAAAAAMGALAERLDLPRERLAEGALQMMNANIESEISKMVFERGVDIRDFALFAYGGAGALHAVDVARAAGISEVIVPALAGGFSAMGLATAPPKVEQALSRVGSLDAFELSELNELFDGMEERMRADLHAQGVDDNDITVTRSVSAMYTGQGFANELELAGWPLTQDIIEEWKGRFHDLYDRLYGYSAPEMGITVTTLSLVAVGPRLAFKLPEVQGGGEDPPADALDGHHPLQLGGTRSDVPFYVRDRLLAGNRIPGPAVIEDAMTTIVVPAGAIATVDNYATVRIAC